MIMRGHFLDDSARITPEELHIEYPLVSVVIPVYNVSRYLSQCMDSVTGSTYQNIEIIVVDDGSTDNSGSICDRYAEKDTRIHVIHTDNRGLSAARNRGLDCINGSYVLFVDSDDWIEQNAIEVLVKTALRTEADIVKAGFRAEFVGKTVCPKPKIQCETSYHNQEIMPAFARGVFGNEVWNKLYSSDCFTIIRFPVGQNFEDVAVTWRIIKKLAENEGTITALPEELFHFRKRKSSISHSWTWKNTNDCWESYHSKFEALPEIQERLLGECFISIGHMWMSYCTFSKEEKARAEKTIQEMNAFSKRHFQTVMRGKYNKLAKMACFFSQSRRKPVLWLSFCCGKIRQNHVNKEYKLFD